MIWKRLSALLLFFPIILCNLEAGPPLLLAMYQLRKWEEESGIRPLTIAPNVAEPCTFKDFGQEVTAHEDAKKFAKVDWNVLTPAAITSVDPALRELERVGFGGSLNGPKLFANFPGGNFGGILLGAQTAIGNIMAKYGDKGSYNLMKEYFTVVRDARRKTIAETMTKNLKTHFDKHFGVEINNNRIELQPKINKPHVRPYQKIDTAATASNLKADFPALNGADVDTYMTDFSKTYNSNNKLDKETKQLGKLHKNALDAIKTLVTCHLP